MTLSPRLLAVLFVALFGGSPAATAGQSGEPPRLMVLVSVDQLRGDLLDRFGPAFTGGFKRLADQGYRFTGASHAHAGTFTAAGHATLATGVTPSRSGIVANNWAHQTASGQWVAMYAVADEESPILGWQGTPGRSPANMLETGLADWAASDSRARVVSLSGKDRAAVTMGGRSPGAHVYWVLPEVGQFVTSTFYRDSYPDWLRRFNETVMPGLLADSVWESSVPPAHASLARPDLGVPYEGDGVHTVFPHRAVDEVTEPGPVAFNEWALSQPRKDRAVLELAKVAVEELELGGRDAVDFLALGLSAADHVGHGYGPLSQEQLDNLLRLDRELGEFLTFLDARVGEGRWVLALSGDHGVMTIPEVLVSEGEAGLRVDARARQGLLAGAFERARQRAGGDPDRFAVELAKAVEARGLVEAAYTHRELLAGEPADSFAVLFRNSHYPGRAIGPLSRYGVEIRFPFNHLVSTYPNGTSHGTPYWYDRWVPFVLLGGGVEPGVSDRPVYTFDVAPTLAALAGLTVPPDRDGKPVYPDSNF